MWNPAHDRILIVTWKINSPFKYFQKSPSTLIYLWKWSTWPVQLVKSSEHHHSIYKTSLIRIKRNYHGETTVKVINQNVRQPRLYSVPALHFVALYMYILKLKVYNTLISSYSSSHWQNINRFCNLIHVHFKITTRLFLVTAVVIGKILIDFVVLYMYILKLQHAYF